MTTKHQADYPIHEKIKSIHERFGNREIYHPGIITGSASRICDSDEIIKEYQMLQSRLAASEAMLEKMVETLKEIAKDTSGRWSDSNGKSGSYPSELAKLAQQALAAYELTKDKTNGQ